MVDKDLTNISLIPNYFIKSIILLCTFHLVKYFKAKIRDDEMEIANNKKGELYDILSKCVYTNDLEKYEPYKKQINEISSKFYEYYLKNWDNCKEIWMHYYRSELPIRATHTDNHIESFNRKIKRRAKSTMHFTDSVEYS